VEEINIIDQKQQNKINDVKTDLSIGDVRWKVVGLECAMGGWFCGARMCKDSVIMRPVSK
jgi:hypothetical protein